MRAWALCLLLVMGCDRKPVDPSPITKIPGLAPPIDSRRVPAPDSPPPPVIAKPEPVEEEEEVPDEEPVAPPKGTRVPTQAQLADRFRVHSRTTTAALSQQDVVIEGSAKGGLLTVLEVSPKGAAKIARHKLDAAAVAQFLTRLDAAKWWTLKSDSQPAADGSSHSLKLLRGDFLHEFQLKNGCACGEKCKCPQLDVMGLVASWSKKLPAKTRVEFAAPKTATFKPPKIPEKLKRGAALACEPGPNGTLACENQRCFPQGKLLACFPSPFVTTGVLGQQQKKKPAKRDDARKGTPHVWAIQTEDGQKCSSGAVPSDYETWSCIADTKAKGPHRDDQVVRVVQAGSALVAVLSGDEFRVTPVTVIWP